jgi:hypothetical protein
MDLEAREKKQQKRLRKEKRKEPDSSLSNALDNPHSRAPGCRRQAMPAGFRAEDLVEERLATLRAASPQTEDARLRGRSHFVAAKARATGVQSLLPP